MSPLLVEEAANMLWRRETGEAKVRQLEHGLEGVEVVLFADFFESDKIEKPNEDDLAKAAIESVAKAETGKDGITYLIQAIDEGVETNLTGRYKAAILAKTDSLTLEEALNKQRRINVTDPNAGNPQLTTAQRIESERKPTIESVQKDIEQGNKYRLELLKHLLTLSAGVLAFTISFRPALTRVESVWLMWAGWIALGVSSSCGMLHMLLWSHFYLSYRDYDWHNRGDEGKRHRKRITGWRRGVMFLQFVGFAVGVLAIAVFAALNFQNVALPK